MSDIFFYTILAITGLFAGVINTLAGGGSNLSIPALMLMGMPADVANATNRIGVLFQSITGVAGFAKHKKLPTDNLKAIIFVTIVSGCLGALSSGLFSAEVLKYVLLGSMILMSLVMIFFPAVIAKRDESSAKTITLHPKSWGMLFIAGFYGGLIQAGVGFILLAALAGALQYDVVRANALKLVCTLVFTIAAVAIFIYQDLIMWLPAMALAAGSVCGAWLGVRVSLNISPQTMRWLLLLMTLIATCLVLLKT
ncbi:sulfite exporter TauE/SafE family protein [Psychrobium sp. 1_MG-2023]|uniref:sulfite exporter TauE/SafE family protein n=1 Tax=Psychrobium sp. 1_MG-2023 TaxID=3062624 RepID=UPI000C32568F|nr:sulfite exporter TauE/SafE family protein [Psychrobium sp. 1_MG-2023]MDP2562348.1 sulfite exporter TauE/SafE family protein [Psychrobium sp. 1_MG-2023]PKF58044.1 sulfite exporter TauE/SafE family protein [Alteromonadales bacterium alter-6D02]